MTAITTCPPITHHFVDTLKLAPVAEFIWRWELQWRKEMREFLTGMPANAVIFITMAVLGLAATLIALRS